MGGKKKKEWNKGFGTIAEKLGVNSSFSDSVFLAKH